MVIIPYLIGNFLKSNMIAILVNEINIVSIVIAKVEITN